MISVAELDVERQGSVSYFHSSTLQSMTCVGEASQHVERAVRRRHHGHGEARGGTRADGSECGPGAIGGTVHVDVIERLELFGACAGRPGQGRPRHCH
jgi:hypothetical protein